jgi:hypothetical protein
MTNAPVPLNQPALRDEPAAQHGVEVSTTSSRAGRTQIAPYALTW